MSHEGYQLPTIFRNWHYKTKLISNQTMLEKFRLQADWKISHSKFFRTQEQRQQMLIIQCPKRTSLKYTEEKIRKNLIITGENLMKSMNMSLPNLKVHFKFSKKEKSLSSPSNHLQMDQDRTFRLNYITIGQNKKTSWMMMIQ